MHGHAIASSSQGANRKNARAAQFIIRPRVPPSSSPKACSWPINGVGSVSLTKASTPKRPDRIRFVIPTLGQRLKGGGAGLPISRLFKRNSRRSIDNDARLQNTDNVHADNVTAHPPFEVRPTRRRDRDDAPDPAVGQIELHPETQSP